MTTAPVHNTDTFKKLVIFTVLMFCFGYLMVPLYEKFCEATGINNLLQPDDISEIAPKDRLIRTEFVTTSQGLVSMLPNQTLANLNVGKTYSVIYTIKNLSDKPITGQAIPSFSPARAGTWFKKIQCFCFEQLQLKPHQEIQAPVVFVIDDTLPDAIKTLSLAYAFFTVEGAALPQ